MAGLCEGGNEPSGSLKAICKLFFLYEEIPAADPAEEVEMYTDKTFVTISYANNETESATRFALFNDAVSTTRLFSVDGIGDSEMLFGEMRPRIRHRLPDMCLMVAENLGKTQPGSEIRLRKPAYNGWKDHRGNHTIPPFWLDDRPPLLRHVDVRPAAGWFFCSRGSTENLNVTLVKQYKRYWCVAQGEAASSALAWTPQSSVSAKETADTKHVLWDSYPVSKQAISYELFRRPEFVHLRTFLDVTDIVILKDKIFTKMFPLRDDKALDNLSPVFHCSHIAYRGH
ncbi:hypothetical protein ANN_08390 [Periplaneta americana]|uniref:Uncharacterized protein n=1 Tax=Periplaneta americana TaxID=6978 RepID=A0ABQ8T2N7_PERAM|nr:hypothetical protein ANN_08390 [Periplaneta americana]